MKLNSYVMYYDHDDQRVRESFQGENGDWVHITTARKLLAENEQLRSADSFSRAELARGNEIIDSLRVERDRLRAENEKLRNVLAQFVNKQDLELLLNILETKGRGGDGHS